MTSGICTLCKSTKTDPLPYLAYITVTFTLPLLTPPESSSHTSFPSKHSSPTWHHLLWHVYYTQFIMMWLIHPTSAILQSCSNQAQTTCDASKLHKICGCHFFTNKYHIIATSKNVKLTTTAELPAMIGYFTTIDNPHKGKWFTKCQKYLDNVHLGIMYGNCVALGGYQYAVVLVDITTRYTWLYGLTLLMSGDNCFARFPSGCCMPSPVEVSCKLWSKAYKQSYPPLDTDQQK